MQYEPSYVYGGNDNGTIRILCPHACGKCNCLMGSAWCTKAKNGYAGKVKIKDDPRFITAPFLGTEAFEKLYNQRTSVERTYGDLKDNYALDNLRIAKMKRAKVFMDLSCISLLASRLAATEKEQQKEIQKAQQLVFHNWQSAGKWTAYRNLVFFKNFQVKVIHMRRKLIMKYPRIIKYPYWGKEYKKYEKNTSINGAIF